MDAFTTTLRGGLIDEQLEQLEHQEATGPKSTEGEWWDLSRTQTQDHPPCRKSGSWTLMLGFQEPPLIIQPAGLSTRIKAPLRKVFLRILGVLSLTGPWQ